MHWILFAVAVPALIGAHLLRLPQRGGWIGATFAFLVGLTVAAIAIKLASSATGFGRTTPFDAFVNDGVRIAEETDAPLIVFNGASFSRNAINDERLTEALRARGYDYRVINLSLEAASLLERDSYLSQFLAASPETPAIVFQEVAQITDARPTFIFGNSKFSTRAIEQFDTRATIWSGMGLAGGGCHGLVDCVKETAFLGIHALLNAGNVGLIGQGERASTVTAARSFDGPTKPRTNIDPDWRSAQLSTISPPPSSDALAWATSFRALQRTHLAAKNIYQTAYYFPPVIEAETRAYVTGLCQGELADFACFSPDDAALLRALDGDHWLDDEHLLSSGADIYADWLADQIVASGILGAPQ